MVLSVTLVTSCRHAKPFVWSLTEKPVMPAGRLNVTVGAAADGSGGQVCKEHGRRTGGLSRRTKAQSNGGAQGNNCTHAAASDRIVTVHGQRSPSSLRSSKQVPARPRSASRWNTLCALRVLRWYEPSET